MGNSAAGVPEAASQLVDDQAISSVFHSFFAGQTKPHPTPLRRQLHLPFGWPARPLEYFSQQALSALSPPQSLRHQSKVSLTVKAQPSLRVDSTFDNTSFPQLG